MRFDVNWPAGSKRRRNNGNAGQRPCQPPGTGLADCTIRNDTNHLALIRDWFGRPLWEMQPADADAYIGTVLREARPATRTGRAAALAVFFEFLQLRHTVELRNLTGRVVECSLDEMNGVWGGLLQD